MTKIKHVPAAEISNVIAGTILLDKGTGDYLYVTPAMVAGEVKVTSNKLVEAVSAREFKYEALTSINFPNLDSLPVGEYRVFLFNHVKQEITAGFTHKVEKTQPLSTWKHIQPDFLYMAVKLKKD